MKKFFALILAAMLCLTMCACGNSNADKQTLIVGFDAEFPPFGFIGADGKYDGFDLAMEAMPESFLTTRTMLLST